MSENDARSLLLPFVTLGNEAFWRGGREGKLFISRCTCCERWIHPPSPICPSCLAADVRPTACSGLGTIWSFSVAAHQFHPAYPTPYVLAVVRLDEQDDLRIFGVLRDSSIDDVRIGLRVRVNFREVSNVFLIEFLSEVMST
jgi:uncharacterized protein